MAIVVSKLTAGSNVHLTTAEEANGMYTDFVSEGVIGTITNTSGVAPATGAFAVNAQGTPDNTVAYSAGVAYVTGTPTSQNSQTFRVKNSASDNLTISANSSGSTKYDWIYIKLDATKLNTPNTAGDDVATVVASRSSSASSDDGTPPTYGYPIAVVTVANGFSTITNGNIRDIRTPSAITSTSNGTSQDWYSTGSVPSSVTYNGNRSYTCVISATDLTGYLSNGMRLKLTRTIAAPTQCTDLESGSSQYYSKTSPAGLTFTDDFTCMGWVKLESYPAVSQGIIARRNADTEGWSLSIDNSGRLKMSALRIAANNSVTLSHQTIPLNKWVHVAASCDLSGTSVLLYIDGILVASATTITGTITALVQGTTALVVGAEKSAGTGPFDGKIAQAAVFSAVLTAATIRSYISQTLSGSETSLVSAYSFNNSIVDLNTSNANDLTAQGSAVATATDTPFAGGSVGTTEYGIVTSNAFSTDTTLTVQVPEGYAIPTSGGVSAISYSTQRVPYGFPANKNKWTLITEHAYSRTGISIGGVNTWVSSLLGLTVPIGAWKIGYSGTIVQASTVAGTRNGNIVLATGGTPASTTLRDTRLANIIYNMAISTSDWFVNAHAEDEVNLTVASQYIIYVDITAATGTETFQLRGDRGNVIIFAECSYV